MRFLIVLTSIFVLLQGCAVIEIETTLYQPKKHKGFELYVNPEFALYFLDNDLGGPGIYKYSVKHNKDSIILTLDNYDLLTMIPVPIKENKKYKNELELEFIDMTSGEPFYVELYINDRIYTPTDEELSIITINKSILSSNNELEIDGGYFTKILQLNDEINHYIILCNYANIKQNKQLNRIVLHNNKMITSKEVVDIELIDTCTLTEKGIFNYLNKCKHHTLSKNH